MAESADLIALNGLNAAEVRESLAGGMLEG
jgi:hypothetical protein